MISLATVFIIYSHIHIHTYNSCMRQIGSVLNTGVACLHTLGPFRVARLWGWPHFRGSNWECTYLVNECEVSLISLILSHKKSEVVTSFYIAVCLDVHN